MWNVEIGPTVCAAATMNKRTDTCLPKINSSSLKKKPKKKKTQNKSPECWNFAIQANTYTHSQFTVQAVLEITGIILPEDIF
jgi:hypothetical protein